MKTQIFWSLALFPCFVYKKALLFYLAKDKKAKLFYLAKDKKAKLFYLAKGKFFPSNPKFAEILHLVLFILNKRPIDIDF